MKQPTQTQDAKEMQGVRKWCQIHTVIPNLQIWFYSKFSILVSCLAVFHNFNNEMNGSSPRWTYMYQGDFISRLAVLDLRFSQIASSDVFKGELFRAIDNIIQKLFFFFILILQPFQNIFMAPRAPIIMMGQTKRKTISLCACSKILALGQPYISIKTPIYMTFFFSI